jgi:hypothetical protein
MGIYFFYCDGTNLREESVMAGNQHNSKRGLASADEATRKKVAQMGGKAHHDKRGAHGSDNK